MTQYQIFEVVIERPNIRRSFMLAVKIGTEAASQRSDLMLCVGNRVEDDLRVDVSDAGLLAIGGMVAMLLSVAVLVGAATRNRCPS